VNAPQSRESPALRGEEVKDRVVRTAPSRDLSGWVRDHTAYRERLTRPLHRQEAASLDMVLLVSFADPLVVPGTGARRSVLMTAHDRPMTSVHAGTQDGLQVRLAPLAAYRLLAGAPVSECTNRVLDLPSALGRRGETLVTRLGAARDGAQRIRLVETALRAWLRSGPPPAPQVIGAWRQLRARHGRVPIGALVDATGWSHRHFTHRFRQQVGVTPKTAARLLRFRHAVALLAGRTGSLADVAADAGYADHAHFTREFATFTGRLPSHAATGSISFKTRSPDCP
jgi:AraC-like DNA-binding protein